MRGERLRKRAARIDRSYTRIAAATSLAAFLAYIVAQALPLASAVPAAITAVIATQASFHQATKGAFIQVTGALVGAAVALGIVSVVGSGAVTILLLVALCFVVARLLHVASPDESPLVATALAVTVILVIGTNLTTELAVERFAGIVIGAIFAVLASYVASPTKATRNLEDKADDVQERLGQLLERIAVELRTDPGPEAVRAWFDEAVDLRNQVLGLAAGLEDLKMNRRWSIRVTTSDLHAVQAEVDACQIMSTRALSLASDLRRASTSNTDGSGALPPA
ncbi:MAG: FUSC family protein, partial [Candidatus Nanopelagicales bacterium]|nr:FUSC family protein [Candidatus Nanopelagicales bacterium]